MYAGHLVAYGAVTIIRNHIVQVVHAGIGTGLCFSNDILPLLLAQQQWIDGRNPDVQGLGIAALVRT